MKYESVNILFDLNAKLAKNAMVYFDVGNHLQEEETKVNSWISCIMILIRMKHDKFVFVLCYCRHFIDCSIHHPAQFWQHKRAFCNTKQLNNCLSALLRFVHCDLCRHRFYLNLGISFISSFNSPISIWKVAWESWIQILSLYRRVYFFVFFFSLIVAIVCLSCVCKCRSCESEFQKQTSLNMRTRTKCLRQNEPHNLKPI